MNRGVQRFFVLLFFSCYRYYILRLGMLTLSNDPQRIH